MASCPDIIERKVVNILSKLGSLYDASRDYLGNQSVNDNTRFLYYLYKHREEKLNVTTGQGDKIVPLPSDLDRATHMITKIVWGFEILCVIRNLDRQSADSIEELLYQISPQLQNCHKALKLSKEEEHQITRLSGVIIFSAKTCVDDSDASLLNILDNRLRDWQKHTTFHNPILYTLCPLE